MAFDFNGGRNTGFPSKIAASSGSPHIYNIRLTSEHDNLTLVSRGDWVAFDEYAEAGVSASFAGIIREQAANGNWYVEVTTPADALLVWNAPVIDESYTKAFTSEDHFYNAAGDVAKCYQLSIGDLYEISESGFSGIPAANKAVSYSTGKYVVAS